MPLSDAKARLAACSSVTRSVTSDFSARAKPPACLLGDVDDQDVLHDQLQDGPVRRLRVGVPSSVETLDVEPAEDVDVVADLHVADEAVRNIDRNADCALVGGQPVADRVGAARRELGHGELLARIDVLDGETDPGADPGR